MKFRNAQEEGLWLDAVRIAMHQQKLAVDAIEYADKLVEAFQARSGEALAGAEAKGA